MVIPPTPRAVCGAEKPAPCVAFSCLAAAAQGPANRRAGYRLEGERDGSATARIQFVAGGVFGDNHYIKESGIRGERIVNNDAWEARKKTINKAAELIVQQHPGTNAAEVLGFVETQFNAMAADPNALVSVDALVQHYESALARQMAGDTRIMARIEKVLFRCLVRKPPNESVQTSELAMAYQTRTKESLRDYLPELGTVLQSLEEREFISVKRNVGGGQSFIFQGVDFDVWDRQMTKEDESKASVVHNYNVNGTNARVNVHSTDNSINTQIAGDGAKVQNELASLRREIDAADLPDTERAEALEQIDGIAEQFASGTPKIAIVNALLNALPKVGSVATIVNAVHGFWPK